MNRSRVALATALLALTLPVSATQSAERQGVVASIKPIHSLVAAVMEGVGAPTLIVRNTGSEHVYSLKPSDASALDGARVIFWVGHEMETFLEKPIETLGDGATVVALGDAGGLERLKFREGGPFEAHSHDDGEENEAGAGHAEEEHDHAHGEYDMHVWLDPMNAKVLVARIAETLSEADPANAARYAQNATAYALKLDTLTAEITAELAPVKDKPFIVFHDAYQYFEKRFGVNAVGSITVSPEVTPGAQRVQEIHDKVKELGATCVFAEPQFEPKLVSVVTEGTTARSGVLDPLGSTLSDGPDLYPQLIRDLASSLKSCLSQAS